MNVRLKYGLLLLATIVVECLIALGMGRYKPEGLVVLVVVGLMFIIGVYGFYCLITFVTGRKYDFFGDFISALPWF